WRLVPIPESGSTALVRDRPGGSAKMVVRRGIVAILVAVAIAGIPFARDGERHAAAAPTVPSFDHIFTVVMENHSYNEIIGYGGAPYINGLAKTYGLAT